MAKKAKKVKFLTAKQLGILPEERKALIDFVKAPVLGRTIAVNGHAHYYDQSDIEDQEVAKANECGTAGCVAGFVFAHARHVQGKRRVRNSISAIGYINSVGRDLHGDMIAPLLSKLYENGRNYKLATARKVVTCLLQQGKVVWPDADGVDPLAVGKPSNDSW